MKKLILLLVFVSGANAQTKNFVPRANGEGNIGLSTVAWGGVFVGTISATGPLTLSGSSLTVTGNELIQKRGAAGTVLTIDSSLADAGGYGASAIFKSNTSGAVTNSWQLGTNLTANANALEIFDGSSLRMSMPIAGGVNVPQGAFSVGGSTLVVTGGNIGIGTTAPGAKLDVSSGVINNAGAGAGITTTGNVTASAFSGPLTGAASLNVLKSGDTMTGPLTLSGSSLTVTGSAFSVGGSTLVVSGGKVGIGGAVDSHLTLYGDGPQVKHIGTDITGSFYDVMVSTDSTWASYFGKDNSAGNNLFGTSLPYALAMGLVSNHPIIFATNNFTRMSILGNGNVGIGTTAPVTKLQVGVGNTSADTAIAKFNTTDTNVAALELSNWDGAAATYGPRIQFDNSGVGTWYIGSSDAANNFDIAATWGTPLLRVTSGGNVAIRTTGSKLIMTSPDGTCSACGPDNADAWACSSVACP